MRRRALVMTLGLLLLSTSASWGQWAVEDAAALAQRAGIWLQEAAQWAQSLTNQAQEIQNTYNVLVNQVKQINLAIQDLQRIPAGLNFMTDIQQLSGRITNLMGVAQGMSFQLNQSSQQFTQLYQQSAGLGSVQQVYQTRQAMLQSRLQAAQAAVQMQSIQTNLSDVMTRLCNLLTGSWTASGNLDSQQIAAQQRGLQMVMEQQQQAMAATSQRLEAQRQAEDVVIDQFRFAAIQGAMGTATPMGAPQGALPTFHW